MGLTYFLAQPFAQHALIAGALIALISGPIGPFVITRNMAFAVHGTAELSFTGAAAGPVLAGDPVVGRSSGAWSSRPRSACSAWRSPRPPPHSGCPRALAVVTALSVPFALIASDGGLIASL